MGPLSFLLSSLMVAARLAAAAPSWTPPEGYGAKGIFPVYEVSGHWLIYDKKSASRSKGDSRLAVGNRFLVVGSAGSGLFTVSGSSAGYGGACKGSRPLKLRTAVLEGPRRDVGIPVVAIQAPPRFNLKRPQAGFQTLGNQVGEDTYRRLLGPLKALLRAEISSGEFRVKPDDEGGEAAERKAEPEAVTKIDFGASVPVAGVGDAFVLVEGSQVGTRYRRCMRLADEGRILGPCAPMRHELMAETSRLGFVAYDPSGKGKPFILAFTASEPLWGHERWGFALRKSGPKAFLSDAMDIRCREGF